MKRYLFSWITILSMDVADPWVSRNTISIERELAYSKTIRMLGAKKNIHTHTPSTL